MLHKNVSISLNNFNRFNLLILLMIIKNVESICVGVETRVCLTEFHLAARLVEKQLTEEDATEKLEYVLSKYEEVEMKITGTPINVRGKRIVYADSLEEIYIGFRYLDNTEYDIIQYCEFVVSSLAGQCESINTFCNTYLPRTPRPLLARDPLSVCEDGVVKKIEENPVEARDDAELEQSTNDNV